MQRETGRPLPILVADDDAVIRGRYVTALGAAGFETLEATDGSQVVELIETHSVGLVLLDTDISGIDGVTLLEHLRADLRTRTLPVILVSGTADIPERVRGLQAGADDYLVKDTDLSELVARVRAHARTRAAWADALAREVENRARVVAELADLTPAATAEETAAAVIDRLRHHAGTAFIALLVCDHDGTLTPLAGWKSGFGPWSAGPPLSAVTSPYLLGRAAGGPWLESGASRLFDRAGRYSMDEVGSTCVVPLHRDGRLLGLLIVATEPGTVRLGETGDLLAATIDYSAVVTALLGSALTVRNEESRGREDVERVIAEQAFDVVFQPLVRLADRRTCGFEALTRFADGTSPAEVFREASRLGLGEALETAVLREVIRVAAELPAELPLGVNVTPGLILDPGWLTSLAVGARQRLVVELTEHAEVEDYGRLRTALEGLRPRVAVAVDDAGAGYASLRHILELRPEYVKLDTVLVRRIETDPVRQALITGLSHFVGEMGSTMIAEGVETEAEAACLVRLGLRFGQGFLFGRPAAVGNWVAPGVSSAV